MDLYYNLTDRAIVLSDKQFHLEILTANVMIVFVMINCI